MTKLNFSWENHVLLQYWSVCFTVTPSFDQLNLSNNLIDRGRFDIMASSVELANRTNFFSGENYTHVKLDWVIAANFSFFVSVRQCATIV